MNYSLSCSANCIPVYPGVYPGVVVNVFPIFPVCEFRLQIGPIVQGPVFVSPAISVQHAKIQDTFAKQFDSSAFTLSQQREYFLKYPDQFQEEIDRKCELLMRRTLPLDKKFKTALCKKGSACQLENMCNFAHTYTALIASNLVLGSNLNYKTTVCSRDKGCRYLENLTCHRVHTGDPIQVLDPVYNTKRWTFYDLNQKDDGTQTVLGVARNLLGADEVP